MHYPNVRIYTIQLGAEKMQQSENNNLRTYSDLFDVATFSINYGPQTANERPALAHFWLSACLRWSTLW